MRYDKISTMTPELKKILDEVDLLDYFKTRVPLYLIWGRIVGNLKNKGLLEDLSYDAVFLEMDDLLEYLNERYCDIVKKETMYLINEERLSKLKSLREYNKRTGGY